MKSCKKLLIGFICGLLCTGNGMSLALEGSEPTETQVSSVAPTNNEQGEPLSSEGEKETQKKEDSNDVVSVKLLPNGGMEGKVIEASNPTTVYNMTYTPSPAVENAMLKILKKSEEMMSKMSGAFDKAVDKLAASEDDSSKKSPVVECKDCKNCNPSNDSTEQVIGLSADLDDPELSRLIDQNSFPCAVLKESEELTKPVFYRTSYDKLSKIANTYLGDSSKVSVLTSMPENADLISRIDNENRLPDDEYLYIPQPDEDADWLLCNVKDGDNFYSLANKYYGSWEYARLLGEFNDHTYNLSGNIYETVVKLPKILCFTRYMVKSEDSTLPRLCEKLLGSSTYAGTVAFLNNVDINKPLKVGSSLFIPTSTKFTVELK